MNASKTPAGRARRFARRVRGLNGYPYAPAAPADGHGRASGAVYWGCSCDDCLAYKRAARAETARRREHNAAVIARLLQPTATVTPDPAPAPELPPPPMIRTPALDEAADYDVPPMLPSVASRVQDRDHLAEITLAYYRPDITTRTGDDRVRQIRGGVSLIVADRPGGPILHAGRRDRAPLAPQPAAPPRGIPRAKGGRGGRHAPRTVADLLNALRQLGLEVRPGGGGHWQTHTSAGWYTIPCTPSDSRSIPNAVAALRRRGVKL